VWRSDGRPEGATLHRLMSYEADPSTLVFTSGSSFAGGVASEDLGRSGKQPWRDRHSSLHAPGSMTEGVRGLPRGGDPAAYHSSEWAHGTFAPPPGGCSQASAHVARHDGAAGRRKTARRDAVVGSDDERSAFGETRRVAPWPVRRGLAAKARASAIPKRASRVKGHEHGASRAPDVVADRRGSPGGSHRRNANRATARRGRGFRAQSACPRVVSRLQTSIAVISCRSNAERRSRAASDVRTT
jgi:hypothetical protein